MKYEQNQYTEGLSVCAWIFAGLFLYGGISGYLEAEYFWSTISLLIGSLIIIGQIVISYNRGTLRNVVLNEFVSNSSASVETISHNTRITTKDVQAIVLDLKADGLFQGAFSHTTGELEQVQTPAGEPDVIFCPNCGTAITRVDATYCPHCGAEL